MAPNSDFLTQFAGEVSDKETPLLVSCGAGIRSAKAVAALEQAGYTALTDVAGGMGAWNAAGLPTVR